MLLTANGIVKLCDFGLTTTISTANSHGNVDLTGTPHYMAPELVTGSSFGPAADIWALGISIIELCEGIVPNARLHQRRVLGSIIEGPSPTLKVPSNWSPSLSDFLTSCLKKEHRERLDCISLLDHHWIQPTASIYRKDIGGDSGILSQLHVEVLKKRALIQQELVRQQQEAEMKLQREKEEREVYEGHLKELEALRKIQLQLAEEKLEHERELERQRNEQLRRYAQEAEYKLREVESERRCIREMEFEDYYSYLREEVELNEELSKTGILKKRAHYLKWWNSRWIHLSRGILRYYLSSDPSDLVSERGMFRLSENTKLVTTSNDLYHLSRNSFLLLNPPLTPTSPLPRLSLLDEGNEVDRETTVLPSYDINNLTSQDMYYFKCANEVEKEEWLHVIKNNILYTQRIGHDERYLPYLQSDLAMRGWAKKKGVYGFWNRRYFILEKNELKYYTLPPNVPSAERPRGVFQLTPTSHVWLLPDVVPPTLYIYEIYGSDDRNWELYMRSDSLKEITQWNNILRRQINYLIQHTS